MAEKKKQTPKKEPKLMDVAKPGKSKPSASSRPLIVGHKVEAQDPMVKEDKEMPEESEEHKIEVKRAGPKVIAPLNPEEVKDAEKSDDPPADESEAPESPADEPKQDDTPPELEAKEEPEAEVTPDEPESPAEEEPETPEEPEEETPTKDEPKPEKDAKDSKSKGIVDAIVNQAGKNKDKKDDKKSEELKKRMAAIEKMVDEKKYFVKTNETIIKKSRTGLVFLILLMVTLAGAYLALDAQLIKNDFKLPYEFFKEEETDTATDLPSPTEQSNNESQNDSSDVVVPDGWTKKTAKNIGLTFALPEGWTFTDHNEGDCIKGHWLEINPTAEAVAKAAVATGNQNFKKHPISVLLNFTDDSENCGDITEGNGFDAPNMVKSTDQLTTGLFAKNWVSLNGTVDGTARQILVSPKSYKLGDDAGGTTTLIKAGSKEWVISIRFDSGANEQMTDFQNLPMDKYLATDLYKDMVKVLNTLEYPEDSL